MKRLLILASLGILTAYEIYRLIRWYRSLDIQLDFYEEAIRGR